MRLEWADNDFEWGAASRCRIVGVALSLILLFLARVSAQTIELTMPTGNSSHGGASSAAASQARAIANPRADEICKLIQSSAAANGLPVEFFARIIWQESRLRPDAVGPMTRTGLHAQGIAQFMPATAAERLLQNPFDPSQALPKSAELLSEFRDQFGNLGLAAAAYNAGPQRVRDWLAGKRSLPSETQAYLRIVTGKSADEWRRPLQADLNITFPDGMSCGQIATQTARPQAPIRETSSERAIFPWGVQLVGDRSELKALSNYRQLQKKHEAILAAYEPVVMRTTIRGGALPIWIRVRVETDSRPAAELLCSRLRAVGESCLVQRN